MWRHRSTILAPLTTLTSKTNKWKWTNVHTETFQAIQKVLAKQVLLAYPDFTKPFHVYTDASKYQL